MGFWAEGFWASGFWASQFWYSTGVIVRKPGGVGSKKKKSVFVEKDKKLYLFKNAAQAAEWIRYQKELESPVAEPSSPLRKTKRSKPIPTPQVIHLDALEGLVTRYQTEYTDLDKLISSEEFDFLFELQAKLQEREDEEIIILLMVS